MKLPKYVITLLATLLFILLFFEKSLGLNVAIYGTSTLVLLAMFKRDIFTSVLSKVIGLGLLLSSICYYLLASPLTLVLAIVSFLLLFGIYTLEPVRNLMYAVPNSVSNFFASIGDFFKSFRGRGKKNRSYGISRFFRIIALPFFIILLFLAVYSMGSTYFSKAVGDFFSIFEGVVERTANYIDIVAVFVGLLGFLFSVLHSLKPKASNVSETLKSDFLTRSKSKWSKINRLMDLSTELKSGMFLFYALSFLLAVLLFLEIKNVWFGFVWEGELLKEFVHEGTYILIFAILLSMAVTMYFFRKNLNFHPKNKGLKIAAFSWIGLNLLLVVSVFIRNYYYIQHFGLAYKRIGVVFFLLLCIVGLISIVVKIKDKRTTYFITRVNSLAAYVTLICICLFNWDVIIAKYNFKNYQTAFVHLPFMSNLSDKALPYLLITDDEVAEIEEKQLQHIPFARKGYFKEVDYQNKIALRVENFKNNCSERHWLEQVWAEKKAYKMLED